MIKKILVGIWIAISLVILGVFIYFYLFVQNFSPGNVGSICDIEIKLEHDILFQLLDSLDGKYSEPDKYLSIMSSSSRKDLDLKVFYFKTPPEEIYYISFGGPAALRYLYDIKTEYIKNGKDKSFNENEISRIKERFKSSVIKDIEQKAKELGIPDSELYYQGKNVDSIIDAFYEKRQNKEDN